MVPSRKVIKREIVELSDEDAKTMGLEAGSHAVSIERINLADGVPIMYEINLFPYQKFAFLLEEPLDGSLFELLEKNAIPLFLIPTTLILILPVPPDVLQKN